MRLILLCLVVLAGIVSAINFDLPAVPESLNHQRCLSQWIPSNTQVKIKVRVEDGPTWTNAQALRQVLLFLVGYKLVEQSFLARIKCADIGSR